MVVRAKQPMLKQIMPLLSKLQCTGLRLSIDLTTIKRINRAANYGRVTSKRSNWRFIELTLFVGGFIKLC